MFYRLPSRGGDSKDSRGSRGSRDSTCSGDFDVHCVGSRHSRGSRYGRSRGSRNSISLVVVRSLAAGQAGNAAAGPSLDATRPGPIKALPSGLVYRKKIKDKK